VVRREERRSAAAASMLVMSSSLSSASSSTHAARGIRTFAPPPDTCLPQKTPSLPTRANIYRLWLWFRVRDMTLIASVRVTVSGRSPGSRCWR